MNVDRIMARLVGPFLMVSVAVAFLWAGGAL